MEETQKYYNEFKFAIEDKLLQNGIAYNLDNDPIMSQFGYANAQSEVLFDKMLVNFKNYFFIPANWGGLLNTPRNLKTPSNGFIAFQGTIGSTILLNSLIKSDNSIIYQTKTTQSILARSLNITSITTTGDGFVYVNLVDNHHLANTMIVNILNVNVNFNTTNAVVYPTGEKSFYYQKTIPANTINNIGNIDYNLLSVEVESIDSGSQVNLDRNSIVQLLSPIVGINTNGFVEYTKILGGTDDETENDYNDRVQFEWTNPITNYNDSTIIATCKEIGGVTRVFIKETTEATLGKTIIRFMRDNDTNPFPTGQAIIDVKDYLLASVYMVGYNPADLDIAAPIPKPYNITFGYITTGYNDSQLHNYINIELQQLFKITSFEKPVSTIAILSVINTGIKKDSRITNAIEIDLIINGVVINYGINNFNDVLPVLGTITYP